MSDFNATPWHKLPAVLAPTLLERLDSIVGSVADEVTTALAPYAGDGNTKLARDVHTGVRVAVERFVDLIGTEEVSLPLSVRATFVELGAAEAREDRTPEVLLSALRLAARFLLRVMSDALAELEMLDANHLVDLADALTAFVDDLAAAATDGFALQIREEAGDSDRRRMLGELLLTGGASERAVLAAAEAIGWHRFGMVVPIIVPPEETRQARFRYRADAVVIERKSDTVLLLLDGPHATRQQLADKMRAGRGVVGPRVGWAQVPDAVRLTEITSQLAVATTGAVFVQDHLATLALRGEHSAFAFLTERRLAGFAAVRESARPRLLDTLDSWLHNWGSRTAVAEQLHIHPQTVSYRIRQLREILGDDLDNPTTRFELMLVLADRRG